MRKLLIIDDEPIVREGLKELVRWEQYGYALCDVGVDGRDGLHKIRYHQPDLVLMDIRMPGFSGIEVIKQLRNEGNNSKFIILTGYSSFSYAKEAIGLGITAFLLKPIDEEELVQAITEAFQVITKEEAINDQLSKYKQLTEEQNLQMLFNEGETVEQSNLFDQGETRMFQVAVFTNEEDGLMFMKREAQNLNQSIKIVKKDSNVCFLFIDMKEEEVLKFLQKKVKLPIIVGSGGIGLEAIQHSYAECKQLRDLSFFIGEHNLLTWELLEDHQDKQPLAPRDPLVISRYIEFNDDDNIWLELQKLETTIRSQGYRKEIAIAESIDYYSAVMEILKTNNNVEVAPPRNTIKIEIYKQKYLHDIMVLLYDIFLEVSNGLNVYVNSFESPVEKVKRYLNQYYYEEELSLKVMADLFNYNHEYLGKKFKKDTGMSFHSYLDHIRIQHAKEKLKEGKKKVYEIAEQVGYRSNDYFYIKFKKYVGCSPKEYQKLQRNAK